MKKIFMITLAIFCVGLMALSFSGCGDKQAPEEKAQTAPIVGKWVYESSDDMYYTFNEDGTGSYFFVADEMKFTYEDDGKTVILHYENMTEPNIYNYTIEEDVLKIEDSFGELVTYIKK